MQLHSAMIDPLIIWARDQIYWAGKPPPPLSSQELREGEPLHFDDEWDQLAALGCLRTWLNEPAQSGVLAELQFGLSQLGWDTPGPAGRRLLSDLLWNTLLARFYISPQLIRPRYDEDFRGRLHRRAPDFCVQVVEAPYNQERWERTAWYVEVSLAMPGRENYQEPLEWVLNALLFFDVELGLTAQPLYRRRHRKDNEVESGLARPETAEAELVGPPLCPKCHSLMVPKRKNRSGRPFWGCPRYPVCDGARDWATARL